MSWSFGGALRMLFYVLGWAEVFGEYLECYFMFWDELKFLGGTQNAILCFRVSWSFWGALRMLFYVLGWAEVFGGHPECYFMFWSELKFWGVTQNAILCFTGAARNLKNLGLTDWTDWLTDWLIELLVWAGGEVVGELAIEISWQWFGEVDGHLLKWQFMFLGST